MKQRKISDRIDSVGAVDWDRRLFDGLIPLPDGTSYNSYLVRGSKKAVLIDAADPSMRDVLFGNLDGIEKIDFIVSNHTEQDHSGLLGEVLARYPMARVLCSAKAKGMLIDHLHLPENALEVVADGAAVSLGDRTLEFIYTPWAHWPETMSTYLREEKVLFSCDFFGSHLAQSDVFVTDESGVYEPAKRYYAEIMQPFRTTIRKNLERLAPYDIAVIAPSHGPVYRRPEFILEAYRDWSSEEVKNSVVIPYVSMHGSTEIMVRKLVDALAGQGITACLMNMDEADIGKLAVDLVDAATVVLGTSAVHIGPHPKIAFAAFLANALRPKTRFASIVGSFGWGQKIVEQLTGLVPNLKVELLPPVLCKGMPRPADLEAVEALAETIAAKHRGLGLLA
jgi:flavorubredoxin